VSDETERMRSVPSTRTVMLLELTAPKPAASVPPFANETVMLPVGPFEAKLMSCEVDPPKVQVPTPMVRPVPVGVRVT
jgi:hypothetical protein